MKYFHISAVLKILEKPEWLDEFRRNFDVGHVFHVTLKNPTEIDEDQIEAMKIELSKLIDNFQIKTNEAIVKFDDLKTNRTSSGQCIMVMTSEGNEKLAQLQKLIHENFEKFGKHVKSEYDEFESNFDPHLTIGRHLSDERLHEAKMMLEKGIEIVGVLEKVTLIVVDEPKDRNWINEKNKKHFQLNFSDES